MAFCPDIPSNVIPPREEGGVEYHTLNFDPADENSGIPPWDPNYVPPDPPVGDPLGTDVLRQNPPPDTRYPNR